MKYPESTIQDILQALDNYKRVNGSVPKIKMNPFFLKWTITRTEGLCVLSMEDLFMERLGYVPPKPWTMFGMQMIEDESVETWELTD